MFTKQNNDLRGFIKIPIIIMVIVSILIIGYVGIKQYQKYRVEKMRVEKTQKEKVAQEKEEARVTAENQQKALEQAQAEIEKFKQESELARQAEIGALKKEIEVIKNVKQAASKTSPSQNTNDELSLIIKKWRPFVAYIECDFKYTDGTPIYTSTGSGLLLAGKSGTILTNRHVISVADKYAPYVCRIHVPDDSQTVSVYGSEQEGGGSVFQEIGSNLDAGAITINHPTQQMINLEQKQPYPLNCYPPSTGDKVVILGYPAVGSKQDITATEGIISGSDGDYFITSAKVEEGNSGGIAVSVKEDCYLGMPTYAEVGNVESLARILDFTVIARILTGQ